VLPQLADGQIGCEELGFEAPHDLSRQLVLQGLRLAVARVATLSTCEICCKACNEISADGSHPLFTDDIAPPTPATGAADS
jgi:hypothetical protein